MSISISRIFLHRRYACISVFWISEILTEMSFNCNDSATLMADLCGANQNVKLLLWHINFYHLPRSY